MMRNSDDIEVGFVVGAISATILIFLAVKVYHSTVGTPFDRGVRAGASGAWVVVELPDGTSKVVENKGHDGD